MLAPALRVMALHSVRHHCQGLVVVVVVRPHVVVAIQVVLAAAVVLVWGLPQQS
jgi:hypothetical protein